jgi:hypothetical protein
MTTIREMLEKMKVRNRMTPEQVEAVEKQGWIIEDYAMEFKYKGYYLVIEFCIGDFCTSICSKEGHWLLEAKVRNKDFIHALVTISKYMIRIDEGEHWQGEED